MVRSRRRLFFETLEVRSLLSGLSYSLTTDQATYQVGQTIEITFTETNTSDQPLTVEVSPTDFTVWQGLLDLAVEPQQREPAPHRRDPATGAIADPDRGLGWYGSRRL